MRGGKIGTNTPFYPIYCRSVNWEKPLISHKLKRTGLAEVRELVFRQLGTDDD